MDTGPNEGELFRQIAKRSDSSKMHLKNNNNNKTKTKKKT